MPDGANAGFTSATSLWRLKGSHDEEKNVVDDVGGPVKAGRKKTAETAEVRKQSSGKLVKPKKTSKVVDQAKPGNVASESLKLEELAYSDSVLKRVNDSKAIRADVYEVPVGRPAQKPTAAPQQSGVSTAYTFQEPEGQTTDVAPVQALKPSKKPRKKAVVATNADGEGTTKRPRKRKVKSEAVIINSDEPEPGDVVIPDYEEKPAHDAQAAHESAARTGSKTTLNKPRKSRAKHAEPKSIEIDRGKATDFSGRETKDATNDILLIEKPVYFAKPTMPTLEHSKQALAELTTESLRHAEDVTVDALNEERMEAACRRRRSWTPAKDSNVIDSMDHRPPTADSSASNTSHKPIIQLTDIIGNFGYVSNDTVRPVAPERTPTGEAVTKRRRVGLADPATVSIATRKAVDVSPPKQTKRKEPKKPQTITALATAAFRPADEADTEQSIVSEFFAPKEIKTTLALPEQPTTPVKPKKPRKPRAKATAAADNPGDAATKPKRTTKLKKAKVKFSEADYLPKLYTPDRASAQLKQQDFLFGTSSQLVLDASPSFVRDMQTALRDSEMPAASQATASPQKMSCARVPTAPHGTCLSIEQADRELWCVAARDFDGGVARTEQRWLRNAFKEDKTESNELVKPIGAAVTVELIVPDVGDEHIVVDLCNTSPATHANDAEDPAISFETGHEDIAEGNNQELNSKSQHRVHVQDATKEDDSWMVLQSDDSGPKPSLHRSHMIMTGVSSDRSLRSLSPTRPALQPLDVNIGMAAHLSPEKTNVLCCQDRLLSTTTIDQVRTATSPSKRPRGRPRKDASPDLAIPISPKRRGRPPKQRALVSDPSTQPRKRKQTKTTTISASQSVPKSDSWLNIDEISDSDSPTTPSPPRRRASSSPPAVQPLQLSPASRPTIKMTAPAAVASTARSEDSQWPTTRSILFPQITAAVKSAPRSTDSGTPSWWEKTLLYDPIVLEDLTAWLNEQGMCVDVKRQKPKPKSKGRKKKDVEAVDGVDEWDVHEEQVHPWMVQKWCEEKSICCLWKEGLRGEVRNRY